MAVTTRNKVAPAKAAATTKKTAPAPKKAASRRAAPEKKPVKEESSSEEEVEDDDEEEQSEAEDSSNSDEEQSEDDNDAEEHTSDSDNDKADEKNEEEESFKIHTPKSSSEPRVAPAAIPTVTYEDDSEDEDSDEAPEAESLSSAKAKVLSAQDKEKSFLSKIQAEQKAKRIGREQTIKAQKEQSKKKTIVAQKEEEVPTEPSTSESTSTTKSGLPTMLPMDILESVAEMDGQESTAQGSNTNDKKRKHMRPEDFALMELEAELKAEAQKRKKSEKTQKNVGPVTVKVLEQSHLAKGHAIPETIIDFRKQHFYGSKIQRKDAVLNVSQRNMGAASKFNRRK
ncbi:hypothetical protein BGZ51_001577 [Haplosporangium sp. Z 767]|nr:hypothetical protein BGZ51_001577 [Haplosporangium sp. Z 767]KAF9188403.1 hypothetical protein BGZ50_001374 [Haplosporangium sp. Z 11]